MKYLGEIFSELLRQKPFKVDHKKYNRDITQCFHFTSLRNLIHSRTKLYCLFTHMPDI